jgi:streptomycin 6-kinase
VLKVAMPLEDGAESFRRAVLAHGLAGGEGCAALLAHDPSVRALLVERLGPDLHSLGLALPEVLDAVADTLVAFWRPVPAGTELPTGADQAGWLATYIASTWADLDEPCPRAVIDRAVVLCERRIAAFDPAGAVLVHGDAHGWNTLRAADDRCKFVDPEGLISSRAHDLAIPMREYNLPFLDGDTPALVRARAEHLAARCGGDIDPDEVWEWGFIERVSTGLANISQLAGSGGEAFLEVAERCL